MLRQFRVHGLHASRPTHLVSSSLLSVSSRPVRCLSHSHHFTYRHLHPSDHGYQEWGDKPGPREVPRWAIRGVMLCLAGAIGYILHQQEESQSPKSEREKEFEAKRQQRLQQLKKAQDVKQQPENSNATQPSSPTNSSPTPSTNNTANSDATKSKSSIITRVDNAPGHDGSQSHPDDYPQTLLDLHRDARSIFAAAIEAADPRLMIHRALKLERDPPTDTSSAAATSRHCHLTVELSPGRTIQYDLDHFRRVLVVGVGKAATRMSAGVEEVLGDFISEGHVVTKYGHQHAPLKRITVTEAAHPVPDEQSVAGTKRIEELVTKYANDPNALIIVLISGGGSSLLVQPAGRLNLTDIQKANRSLLRSGMNISQFNQLRKHMDDMKGGGLLQRAGSTQVLSLILSDVVGDNLQDIASAPTLPFQRDYTGALHLLDQYHLRPSRLAREARQFPDSDDTTPDFPVRVYEHLLEGAKNQSTVVAPDCPGYCSPMGSSSPSNSAAIVPASSVPNYTNLLVGSNLHSLRAAATRATQLGYQATILTDRIEGEAKDVAAWLSRVAIPVQEPNLKRGERVPRAFIAGGETTVSFNDSTKIGLGGRNQEFALAGAVKLHQHEIRDTHFPDVRTVLLAGGTDGTDALTDATGAVVDALTITRAERMGLSANQSLKQHDSYHFFQALDATAANNNSKGVKSPPLAHIKTGPTGTNVADVYLALTK